MILGHAADRPVFDGAAMIIGPIQSPVQYPEAPRPTHEETMSTALDSRVQIPASGGLFNL